MSRDINCPAIYKHFKNKFYATMGITETITHDKLRKLLSLPNTIYFKTEHTEREENVLVVICNDKFYTTRKEIFVVYKSLYDGNMPYVRPIEMFTSEVDKKKYPEIEQKYRFEMIKY